MKNSLNKKSHATLALTKAEVKMRMEEILKLKNQLRLEKETVQQKEIEISRLHGQVATTRIINK